MLEDWDPDGMVAFATYRLLVGYFLEVLKEADLVGVREIQMVFACLVLEEPLGVDGFGCSLGFFVVEPLCGVRGLSYRKRSRVSLLRLCLRMPVVGSR